MMHQRSRTDGAGDTLGRMLAWGALVWGLYSVLYVITKGLVLDEAIIPAQIITGTTPYPADHPHLLYYLKAYSLPNYLSAGLWTLLPSATVLFVLRNVSFLFLSALVPFAFATVLTRHPLWGHVAAALTLTETLIVFNGVYPMWVFPIYYSHGHIGLHLALLSVALLLAGLWRTGGGLFGLMPSLHLSMAAVTWPWCGLFFLAERRRIQGQDRTRLILAVSLGLVVCAALAAVIAWRTAGGTAPMLSADQETEAYFVYQQFSKWTDVHSQPFSLRSFAYVINPLAFFVLGALLLGSLEQSPPERQDRRNIVWILLLGGFVWAIVYSGWLYQTFIGPLPFVLNAPRPFRFSNITALLLIPLTITGIAYARKQLTEAAKPVTTALVTGLILGTVLYMLVSKENTHTYLVLMGAWGLFFAIYLYAFRKDRRRLYGLLAFLVVGGFILFASIPQNYWIGTVLLTGFFGTLAALYAADKLAARQPSRGLRLPRAAPAFLLGTCILLGLITLADTSRSDWRHFLHDENGVALTKWDSFSSYDAEIADWLDAQAAPDEMILTTMYPRSEIQAKTGHPVLFEPETMWLLTYMPDLAPTINAMTRDLYGLDYSRPEQLEQRSRDGHIALNASFWREIWEQRPRAAWQSLSEHYDFRFVLSSPNTRLDLPVAIQNPLWTLYEIPSTPVLTDR